MVENYTQTIGYPRIGKNRQVKWALEDYWKGKLSEGKLLETCRQVEEESWEAQHQAGIGRIGVGDGTLYDHVLDWAIRFGLIPGRFQGMHGLERYFAMARGVEGVPPLELTKWFDTNYHYLVPEIEANLKPRANFADFLETVRRAAGKLPEQAVPIVLGPLTLLSLSHNAPGIARALEDLLPLYRDLLTEIRSLGVVEVQLHEPVLVLGSQGEFKDLYRDAYSELTRAGLRINLVTCFDDLGEQFSWVVELPVDMISLDFTRGDNMALIKKYGWPEDKVMAAGVVDGRNVWRIRPGQILDLLRELGSLAPLRVGPSCSLQFVPYQASREPQLPEPLRGALAFAEEKLEEVHLLGRVLQGEDVWAQIGEIEKAWERFNAFAPADPALGERLRELTPADFQRPLPYVERRRRQVQVPRFPTTTIGSFPQTQEVRRLRSKFKTGEVDQAVYQAGIDRWIKYAIDVQERIGLDIPVHGEFERSDMVEYFAVKMTGFAFTENGWVQSYGNRYVRPPIIYGDILRPEPMTVREFLVAQSATQRPVKGMLTGPVTILNWSYPRIDIPRREIAFQLALALRDEITDLARAGARIVQVDEPALREGLPLKPGSWKEYLSWAVDAFRLATGGAEPELQIHTHMCYSEFGDIMEAIDRLDADVISIENARSGDVTLRQLAEYGYQREVGPGVYDVHSSVVPEAEHVEEKLRTLLTYLRPEQIWVNPDCGLKTRAWEEVIPALEHILAAVQALREGVRVRKLT